MAHLYKTPRYTRASFGADGMNGRRNVCNISFVKTDLRAPVAASATAVAGSLTLTTSGTTSQVITRLVLDVPRNITITLAGTTANIGAGNITITGYDTAGQLITDTIAVTAATGGLLTGTKAFKSVMQFDYPATTGSGVTSTVGIGSKLGIKLCNLATGQVRVWAKTTAGQDSHTNETLIAPTASNLDPTVLANNTVTVNGTLDGTINYYVYVLNYNWILGTAVANNANQFGLK